MPRYEYSAFLAVEADTRAEADQVAREVVDELSGGGEFSFALDESEPTVEADDASSVEADPMAAQRRGL